MEAEFPEEISTIMGALRKDGTACGSRIHVSHLYRETPKGPYFLKIWGDAQDAAQKDRIVDIIKRHIADRFKKDVGEPENLHDAI